MNLSVFFKVAEFSTSKSWKMEKVIKEVINN